MNFKQDALKKVTEHIETINIFIDDGWSKQEAIDYVRSTTVIGPQYWTMVLDAFKPKVKLLKKGIKIDGQYYPVFYSSSKNHTKGMATIYIKTYKRLPPSAHEIFSVKNDTDSMTDYFEQDRINIPPDSPFFKQVENLS